jgi:hypothetical protein
MAETAGCHDMTGRTAITSVRRYTAAVMLIAVITTAADLHAQRTKSSLSAGNQRNAEKGLKDNRYFFYFINSSITNLGAEEEKRLFREAIQRDIIAQQLYMKFLFLESFREIRRAQKILIDLYRITLARDIGSARGLLNGFAPAVVKSKDYLARHYLRLGYRDTEDARIDMVMADNFQENLYSMRLYRYSKAIKKVKHGRRYAFFSMLEATTTREDRRELGRHDYKELRDMIESASEPDRKERHLLIHADNYYLPFQGQSFYDRVWDSPNLGEIPEYDDYLKMN